MGFKKLTVSTFKSLLVWSTLLAFFLPGYFLMAKLKKESLKQVYEKTIVQDINKKMDFDDLQLEINIATEAELEKRKEQAIDKIEKKKEKLDDNIQYMEKFAIQQFDSIVPRAEQIISLPDEKPKLYRVYARVEYEIRSNLQEKIKEKRNNLLLFYKNKIEVIKILAKDNNQKYSTLLKKGIKDTYKDVDRARKNIINYSFSIYRLYGYTQNLLLLILVVQSFSYVFARISVKKKNKIPASLGDKKNNKAAKAEIRCCGQKYTLSKANKGTFYYTRKVEAFGCPPQIAIPNWKTSTLARLRSRFFVLNKVDMSKNSSSVYFTTTGSNQFVEWKLKKGEKAVFNYKDLILVSQTVQLRRMRSLKITSLLFGTIFFKIAEGPGKIVLMSKGKPIVSNGNSQGLSVSQENILAWGKEAKFEVEAKNNPINMFFSSYNLKRIDHEPVIIDADVKGRAKTGLSRFIRRFALPF
jgi:hypothetical protein